VSNHYSEIAVVVIAGVADIKLAVRFLSNGACDNVTKPFNLLELKSTIDNSAPLQAPGRAPAVSISPGTKGLRPDCRAKKGPGTISSAYSHTLGNRIILSGNTSCCFRQMTM
jgi:hypothetical protein